MKQTLTGDEEEETDNVSWDLLTLRRAVRVTSQGTDIDDEKVGGVLQTSAR